MGIAKCQVLVANFLDTTYLRIVSTILSIWNDPSGHWPKWLTGAINVVGGALQAVAGAALVAAAPVSGGLSAVVGGALLINGAATIAAGAGQIINDVSNSNVMPEENALKTSAKAIGKALGGDTGEKVAGGVYDVVDTAASIYSAGAGARAGTRALQQAGRIPVKVNIKDLVPDPNNPMTAEGINYWTKTLSQNSFKGYNSLPNAYGLIEPIAVQKGTMLIANGHHRVAVLSKYGVETIKVYLVP